MPLGREVSGFQTDPSRFRREQDCYSKDNGSPNKNGNIVKLNIRISIIRENCFEKVQRSWSLLMMRMGSETIQHEKHPNKTSKHANQKVPEDSNSFNFWKGRNKIHTTQLQPTHNSSEHLKLKRTSLPHPETVDGGTRDEEMEAQATPRPLSIAQFVATIRVDHRPKKVSSLHCKKACMFFAWIGSTEFAQTVAASV